jgi:acetyl esterase/lipase
MTLKNPLWAGLAALQLMIPSGSAGAADSTPEIIALWPGTPPGTEDWTGPERIETLPFPGTPIRIVHNVTQPTLTVYRPASGKANGTAMIIIPGGGFQTLAIDHEGDMVARWLIDRGVTAFVLKYRVRDNKDFKIPPGLRQHPERFAEFARQFGQGKPIAIADATQAMHLLRTKAGTYGIAPDRIGMIGFSAGAITTMGVVMDAPPGERPNFAAPIYGAMDDKEPPKDAPPLFIAVTEDDPAVPAVQSIAIFNRWNAAGLPAELHVYERGGHGFGMMSKKLPVDGWTTAFESWLGSHGLLPKPAAR